MENKTPEPNFEGEEMKMPTQQPVSDESSGETVNNGTVITALIIILIAILAGLFYWFFLTKETPPLPEATTRPTLEMNKEPETPTATAQVESLSTLSTSDEISAIEADLGSTILDSLDSELTQIDTELEAALE